MMAMGVLALAVPHLAGITMALFCGVVLVLSGLVRVVFAWYRPTAGGRVGELLMGVIDVAVGLYLCLHLVTSLASLTLVLAAYLGVEAVLELIVPFRHRPRPGSNWLLMDGLVTLGFAVVMWQTWPSSTAGLIGALVGLSMLVRGIARLRMVPLTSSRGAGGWPREGWRGKAGRAVSGVSDAVTQRARICYDHINAHG
jgi:uncharacterized membrane protein HdeD (DUF308 family)